ncbi:MAG: phenylalanine--tRNA ligase subunit beta [Myxococcota bacterium]|nr:phenylalanine--tRNA ligase subunit beta [Myxococcota bacterium]
MKASVRWLRELCPQLPDDANALAARFTAAGLAVDGMQRFGLGDDACIIARVLSSRAHPSRTALRLVTVDGGGAPQEVVCGAPNLPEPGRLVALAPLGAHLPAKGLTIERRTIAGVASEGMLCSEAELGLSDDADGILVLPSSVTARLGTPLVWALPEASDTILELDLTPNRPDGLGHVGLAREAAALFNVPFLAPHAASEVDESELLEHVSVTIEDADRCPHYGAALFSGAKILPSPFEVRWRLGALGVRPISNAVDVTNLMMLEFGHPMHAFDFDQVRGGRMVVRRAREGEKLVTLDGTQRSLSTDDLVICDHEGPVALAGVMGGGGSEITDSTSRILLECAYFEPRGVRRAGRRHGLHTESSHRFERGVDWGDTRAALDRASTLLMHLTGATALGRPHVFEAQILTRRTVTLRHTRLCAVLGADVGYDDARGILGRLGFSRSPQGTGVDAWQVPTHRSDVAREVDLIEEVARVRGYATIPSELPAIRPSRDRGPREGLARRVRQAAVEIGLSEAITHSFVAPGDLEAVGAPSPAVTLRNPLREDQSVMRTSLLPGLLHAVSRARRHCERDARMFCVGPMFLASGGPAPDERLAFAAVLAGQRSEWLGKAQPVDVWDAKGLAEGLIRRVLRRQAVVRRAPTEERPRHLHPRGAARIDVDGKSVGTLGPIHPDIVDAFDLGEGSVVVLEMDLEALDSVGVHAAEFVALPRFPANLRDIAVVVPDGTPAGDLARAVRIAAGDLAEEVTLFDRFAGGSIPSGHASLALRVVYRAADRTLTDAEVDARHAQVVAEIQSRFGGRIRT